MVRRNESVTRHGVGVAADPQPAATVTVTPTAAVSNAEARACSRETRLLRHQGHSRCVGMSRPNGGVEALRRPTSLLPGGGLSFSCGLRARRMLACAPLGSFAFFSEFE